jgi:hypothetical protein
MAKQTNNKQETPETEESSKDSQKDEKKVGDNSYIFLYWD